MDTITIELTPLEAKCLLGIVRTYRYDVDATSRPVSSAAIKLRTALGEPPVKRIPASWNRSVT